MYEVEVKVRCSDLIRIKKQFEKLGATISEAVTQYDTVYTLPGDYLGNFPVGHSSVRVRSVEQGGVMQKHILTLKKTTGKKLIKLEKETIIDDPDQMKDILENMGRVVGLALSKTRQTTDYNGMHFCFDTVEGIGSYVEGEIMSDSVDAEKLQDQLLDFLESVGLSRDDKIMKGYDVIYLEKYSS